jgi:hypothetical protein
VHELLLGDCAYVVAPEVEDYRCNFILIAYILGKFEQVV